MEIKRLSLPAATPLHERYRWLRYERQANQLTPLDFVSMRTDPPFEEREFRQGSLRFSAIEGIFRPAGSSELLALRRDFLMELPPALTAQLAQLP